MLIWRLDILLKYFTATKDEFCMQRMNKKIRKEAKRKGKRLKATRKTHIGKNEEKEDILYSPDILGLSCMQ